MTIFYKSPKVEKPVYTNDDDLAQRGLETEVRFGATERELYLHILCYEEGIVEHTFVADIHEGCPITLYRQALALAELLPHYQDSLLNFAYIAIQHDSEVTSPGQRERVTSMICAWHNGTQRLEKIRQLIPPNLQEILSDLRQKNIAFPTARLQEVPSQVAASS